jgi:hypothetical protein
MEQEWKPVKNYEGLYEINEQGKVRSLQKRNANNIMPQRIGRGGYYTVRLSKIGKDTTVYIHRLLGFAYIPNVDDKPFINHINGDKLDNRIENLEWCTHSENMKHAYKTGLLKVKSTSVIDICTGKTYNSIKEASEAINISYGTCRNYLNGNIKTNKTCLRLAS